VLIYLTGIRTLVAITWKASRLLCFAFLLPSGVCIIVLLMRCCYNHIYISNALSLYCLAVRLFYKKILTMSFSWAEGLHFLWLTFSLLPPLLPSLVDIEYESMCSRRKAGVLVFDLACLSEASVFVLSLWPSSLSLLGVDRDAIVCRSREAEVLVFDLADVAKVLAQFEHSLEVLIFILDASPEATE